LAVKEESVGKFLDFLLGRSLANQEEGEQCIGAGTGVALLGLDALTSSAYGPEAAATVLLPLGAFGIAKVLPITIAIVCLLTVVYFSYRQTISAYPNGGGSYTVARENLGDFWGLLAAALMLDYILTAAVGISAGTGALISALPVLQPYTLSICLITLVFITLVNLRGVRESGAIFIIPTYLFISAMLSVLGLGIGKSILANGHPASVVTFPHGVGPATEVFGLWILARAFASGCTAMTGVEAVSNGVKVFHEPVVPRAKRTLSSIVILLILMLLGIAYLANAYGIAATDPGVPGYESLLSQLLAAIVGRGIIYYVTIGSVVAVLMLSANTAFADFPRMCQLIARDNYLPHSFADRGRRLVFSNGIFVLAAISGLLLWIFGGVTDRLIPLYAIGAFLAFTLSQAGMVAHWLRQHDLRRTVGSILINGFGAFCTGLALLVVMVSKFAEGGWITLILIFGLLSMFYGVRRHYVLVLQALRTHQPLSFDHLVRPVVVIPFRGWNRITSKALRFALMISDQIYGVYVENSEPPEHVTAQWDKYVREPAKQVGRDIPELTTLPSPYRRVFGPMMSFVDEIEKKYPDRHIAVLIPSLVEQKWYQIFLHNQRAVLLEATIRLRSDPRIITMTVPWYL
jgi:amino acid transporter